MKCFRCTSWPCTCKDGQTIIHGDCREVLPALEPVDLVLTDPPYGINHKSGGGKKGKWCHVKHQGHTIVGDFGPFDPTFMLLAGKSFILWGANFYSNKLPNAGWLVWDKRPGIEDMKFNRSDSELAFFSGSKTIKTFRHLWHGLCRATEIGEHRHPTQKPVALMKWCLRLNENAQTVLDPFLGSGPTLRACKDLGRRGTGIEIEERYCEIAANRLKQEVLF